MNRPANSRRLLVLAAVVALVAVAGGVAMSVPDSSGVIHACSNTKTGSLRVVDTEATPPQTCAKSERALTWNQRGPAGPPGTAVSGYVLRFGTAVVGPGEGLRVEAGCFSGQAPVGGGFETHSQLTPSPVQVIYSKPAQVAGGSGWGWAVFFQNTGPNLEEVTVYASCIPISGDVQTEPV
jgi:hypothetical protein